MIGKIDHSGMATLNTTMRNGITVGQFVRPIDSVKPRESSPDQETLRENQQQLATTIAPQESSEERTSSPFSSFRETLSRAFQFGQTTAGGQGLLGALTSFITRLLGQEQQENPSLTDVAETFIAANDAYDYTAALNSNTASPYGYADGHMMFATAEGSSNSLTSGRFLDLNI